MTENCTEKVHVAHCQVIFTAFTPNSFVLNAHDKYVHRREFQHLVGMHTKPQRSPKNFQNHNEQKNLSNPITDAKILKNSPFHLTYEWTIDKKRTDQKTPSIGESTETTKSPYHVWREEKQFTRWSTDNEEMKKKKIGQRTEWTLDE